MHTLTHIYIHKHAEIYKYTKRCSHTQIQNIHCTHTYTHAKKNIINQIRIHAHKHTHVQRQINIYYIYIYIYIQTLHASQIYLNTRIFTAQESKQKQIQIKKYTRTH